MQKQKYVTISSTGASWMAQNLLANAGDAGDVDSIPGSKRPLEGGHGNPSSILAWESLWTEEPGGLHGVTKPGRTERLSQYLYHRAQGHKSKLDFPTSDLQSNKFLLQPSAPPYPLN